MITILFCLLVMVACVYLGYHIREYQENMLRKRLTDEELDELIDELEI